ncbi:helix-turn-helix transcriptional regulator [Streptomyces marincola]|uniref:helix-turn-helix transcriptional regulator n=1 Tax=Streptomyces marincola TaxID=2878388 RepID=UPI001CF23960|nr:WYL domain-containing protein [Streptomyces marincola]UCM90915.1 WYL domain-containing protein [Streptomyces marincola]
MTDTSARLLRLLGLLQTRREWPAPALAERLGVSTRTIRRDIDRLRRLDYPIEAGLGPAGGYRLGAGAALPPLPLDEDEAVAVAVGLRTAAGSGVEGIGETAVSALVKLRRLMPDRLRRRMDTLHVRAVSAQGPPTVPARQLTAVATACRDRERLRFDYEDHHGRTGVRTAEPHELVAWGGRWYLVAWDVDREGWRTFRVDRLRCRVPTGPRFTPRPLPEGDAVRFVTGSVARLWPHRATVRLHVPADAEAARAAAPYGRLEPVDDSSCLLRFTADSRHGLVFLLGALDVDFDLVDPPELAGPLRQAAGRLLRAADAAGPAARGAPGQGTGGPGPGEPGGAR